MGSTLSSSYPRTRTSIKKSVAGRRLQGGMEEGQKLPRGCPQTKNLACSRPRPYKFTHYYVVRTYMLIITGRITGTGFQIHSLVP